MTLSAPNLIKPVLTALFLALCLTPPAAAEGPGAQTGKARILAIGDSLMTWNRIAQRSIPQVVAAMLREPVQSRANVGAHMIYNLPISGALGKRISSQFGVRKDAGSFDWVLVTGGGNDLWLGCGCSRCQRRMAKMISPDGQQGAVPNLMRKIRSTGAQVIYIGYLRSPGYGTLIDHCRNEGDALEARLAMMAKYMPGVHFLSMADLVPHGDRSYHALDGIHPSQKGSVAIARRVVAHMRSLGY